MFELECVGRLFCPPCAYGCRCGARINGKATRRRRCRMEGSEAQWPFWKTRFSTLQEAWKMSVVSHTVPDSIFAHPNSFCLSSWVETVGHLTKKIVANHDLTACCRGDGKVPCSVGQNCPAEHSLACGSSVRALNLAMRLPRPSIWASVAHDPTFEIVQRRKKEKGGNMPGKLCEERYLEVGAEGKTSM